MSLYSDNQTKHFFVINYGDNVKISNLNGTDKFRVIVTDSNGKGIATTDVLSEKLILNKKMNLVKPVYYRQWEVKAMTAVTADTTYYLYFYLENMLGFGMQDRWDRVASYTAESGDSPSTVMQNLAKDLDLKLNGKRKEVAGDTTAQYLTRDLVTKGGPITNDFVITLSGNDIIVKENEASSDTYSWTKFDTLTHGNPYVYNVTMSTFDGTNVWNSDGKKEILATNTATERIKSGMKVFDMEQYFLRNRADKYSLTPDFYTSIINEPRADVDKNYICFDIHYAFSDSLGFTYFSEKDLTLAVDSTNTGALTALAKVFNVESNANLDSIGYIYDEASWAANYWRLADYFATGNTANKDAWNGDGWIVWNFPAGKYAGKTIAVTCSDGTTTYTSDNASATGTTSYFIASTTTGGDWYGGTAPVPATFTTIDKIGTNNIGTSIS